MEILISFCKDNALPSGYGNVAPMTTREMFYITIWYLANQCPPRAISIMFNRLISSIWRATDRITKILETNQQKFINWPTPEEASVISDQFKQMAGFPGVLGDIDGTHIHFQAHTRNQKDYNNRKFFHSLNLQAVCLPNRAFSYTFAGFPGSAHDVRVFRCSDLHNKMNEDSASLSPTTEYHILGDSAFPCSSYLIPAIKSAFAVTGKTTVQQKIVQNPHCNWACVWRLEKHVEKTTKNWHAPGKSRDDHFRLLCSPQFPYSTWRTVCPLPSTTVGWRWRHGWICRRLVQHSVWNRKKEWIDWSVGKYTHVKCQFLSFKSLLLH